LSGLDVVGVTTSTVIPFSMKTPLQLRFILVVNFQSGIVLNVLYD
jgi:hypothetical protein